MSEKITVELVENGLELAILSVIAKTGSPVFALDIRKDLTEGGTHILTLDELYEVIIDLLAKNRICVTETNPGKALNRRMYGLVIPETMVAYSPAHCDYPNPPKNWNREEVLHLAGDYCTTHGINNDLAWFYDGHQDGTNIIAYNRNSSEE